MASVSPAKVRNQIAAKAQILTDYSKGRIPLAQAVRIYESAWAGIRHQAAVDDMVVGRDGTFWLRRGGFAEPSVEWMIFNAKGDYAGRVNIPAETRVVAVSRAEVWTVELDENDVPYVLRSMLVGG